MTFTTVEFSDLFGKFILLSFGMEALRLIYRMFFADCIRAGSIIGESRDSGARESGGRSDEVWRVEDAGRRVRATLYPGRVSEIRNWGRANRQISSSCERFTILVLISVFRRTLC